MDDEKQSALAQSFRLIRDRIRRDKRVVTQCSGVGCGVSGCIGGWHHTYRKDMVDSRLSEIDQEIARLEIKGG